MTQKIFIIFFLGLIVSGCVGLKSNKIVGDWETKGLLGTTTLSFYDDSSGLMQLDSFGTLNNFKYKIIDDSIIQITMVSIITKEEITKYVQYKFINDDTLLLNFGEGYTTYVRKK